MRPCVLIFLLFFCLLPVIFVPPRHPLNLGLTVYVFSCWKNNCLCSLLMFEPPSYLLLWMANLEDLLINGCTDFPDKRTCDRRLYLRVCRGQQTRPFRTQTKQWLLYIHLFIEKAPPSEHRQRLHSVRSFLSCAAGCVELFRHKTRTKDGQIPAIDHIIAICISFAWLISCCSSLKKNSQFLLSHIYHKCELVITFISSTITFVQGAVCVHSPQAHPLWWRIN